MMNYIILGIRFLLRHKFKILLTLFCSLVFLFILFPMNDLNDLVTTQISNATQRRIFVQFEDMKINPLSPSITVEKVYVDSAAFPTLNAQEISVRPSMASILAKLPTAIKAAVTNDYEALAAKIRSEPEGSVSARGILGGDVSVQIKNASKSEAGVQRSNIEIQATDINLKDVRDLASLPMAIRGKANFSSSIVTDLALSEQPEGEMSLMISRFELPPSSVNLGDMGAVNLPEVKFAQVELKGKLSNGKFQIETGKLGNNKDDLYGEIKGQMGLTFVNRNGAVTPMLGSYNLDIDLTTTSRFQERAKFFLTFLDGYKTDPQGSRYKFKVQAAGLGAPPNITPLR